MYMQDTSLYFPPAGSGLELKPCPFCGCSLVGYEQYNTVVGLRWRVVCFGCMAGIDTGCAMQKCDVAAAWNRRVNG